MLVPRLEKPVPSDRRVIKPSGRVSSHALVSVDIGVSQTKHFGPVSDLAISFVEGAMNLFVQPRHKTCPQSFAMTDPDELERRFRHEGQTFRFSPERESGSSSKCMAMSLLIDMLCGSASAEAGQVVFVLPFFVAANSMLLWAFGVKDGVQKDGKGGVATCFVQHLGKQLTGTFSSKLVAKRVD